MDDLPEDIQQAVNNFGRNLSDLESALDPFFEDKELPSKLTPLESAKSNLVAAYAMNTLFYMYLQSQGVKPDSHPVKGELDRIRTNIAKIKNLSQEEKDRANQRFMDERTLRVDTAAAGRFVKHYANALKEDSMDVDAPNEASSSKPSSGSSDSPSDSEEELQKPSGKSKKSSKIQRKA